MERKIEHMWSILCEKSITDQDSNNISLQNVLEQLQINPNENAKLGNDLNSAEKTVPINFELISLWDRVVPGDIDEQVTVALLDPEEKIIAATDHPLKLAASLQRLRFRIRYNAMKVTIPGKYRFSIRMKKENGYEEVGKAYLEIKIAAPQKTA
jgi:hypothetical protein